MTARMDPAERREALLSAAMKVSNKVGVKYVTREMVAQEAGVSTGLISRYFSGIDELINDMIKKAISERDIGVISMAIASKHKATRRIAKNPQVKKDVITHMFGA